MALQPGDVVRLKSGSPDMTVRWVSDGDAHCTWFDKTDQKTGSFPEAALEKAPPKSGVAKVVRA